MRGREYSDRPITVVWSDLRMGSAYERCPQVEV